MRIDISKRYFFGILSVLLVLGITGFGFAYNADGIGGVPSQFGHSSDEVEITINGQTKTLQSAIDAGDLSGGSGSGSLAVIGPLSGSGSNEQSSSFNLAESSDVLILAYPEHSAGTTGTNGAVRLHVDGNLVDEASIRRDSGENSGVNHVVSTLSHRATLPAGSHDLRLDMASSSDTFLAASKIYVYFVGAASSGGSGSGGAWQSADQSHNLNPGDSTFIESISAAVEGYNPLPGQQNPPTVQVEVYGVDVPSQCVRAAYLDIEHSGGQYGLVEMRRRHTGANDGKLIKDYKYDVERFVFNTGNNHNNLDEPAEYRSFVWDNSGKIYLGVFRDGGGGSTVIKITGCK